MDINCCKKSYSNNENSCCEECCIWLRLTPKERIKSLFEAIQENYERLYSDSVSEIFADVENMGVLLDKLDSEIDELE